jgi:hypothetical protein
MRKGRSPADRRREDFEWRERDEEYRALARELHREWCERLDDDGNLIDENDES